MAVLGRNGIQGSACSHWGMLTWHSCACCPAGEGALFEFDASKQWRERGRGEMRLNVAPRCGLLSCGMNWVMASAVPVRWCSCWVEGLGAVDAATAAAKGTQGTLAALLSKGGGTLSTTHACQHGLSHNHTPLLNPCLQRPGAAGDAAEGQPAPAAERQPVGRDAGVQDGGWQGARGGGRVAVAGWALLWHQGDG